jgi:hypothetical protein
VIDCRSEEGVTVGLIDAMISIARVLCPRLERYHDADDSNILEALKDLASDEDIARIVSWAGVHSITVNGVPLPQWFGKEETFSND